MSKFYGSLQTYRTRIFANFYVFIRELWVPKFYEFCDFSIFRLAYLQELQSELAKTWQSNRTPTFLENLKIWWRQDIHTVREWRVLKLASLYTFPRRRTSSTFAAPPVGESYETYVSKFTYYPGLPPKLPKIVAVSFQLFYIMGGQKWRFVIKICTLSIFG